MTVKNFTAKDFASLIKRGRGEAMLILKASDSKEAFYPTLLDAAWHDYNYDKQCNDSLSGYIYALIRETEYADKLICEICGLPLAYGEDFNDWDYQHYVNMLWSISDGGTARASDKIRDYYDYLYSRLISRRKEPSFPVDLERQDFEFTAITAMASGCVSKEKAVSDIGRLITENPLFEMWDFSWFAAVVEDELSNKSALTESDDKYTVKFFADYQAEKEREKALAETRKSTKIKHVEDTFEKLEDLFAEFEKHLPALNKNEEAREYGAELRTANRLFRFLCNRFGGEKCYEDLLPLLPADYAIMLKSAMLAVDSPKAFGEFVYSLTDEDAVHSICMTVTDLWEYRDGKGLSPDILYVLYDATPCSTCRYGAVSLMKKHGCLPDEIKAVGIYDSDEGTRELCN